MEPAEFRRHIARVEANAPSLADMARDGPDADAMALRARVDELTVALEELRATDHRLRRPRDDLLAASDEVPGEDGYLITDSVGMVRGASDPAATLLNRDRAQLLRTPLAAYVDVRDRRRFRSTVARLAKRGGEAAISLRMTPLGAPPFMADVRVTARRDPGDAPVLRWVLRDASAHEVAWLVASIPQALYVGTTDGLTFANASALQQLGCASIDALSTMVRRAGQPFERALRGEPSVGEITVHHDATSRERVLRVTAAPLFAGEAVVGAVAINTDITDERERMRAILDALPVGVLLADTRRDHPTTVVNAWLRRLAGMTPDPGGDFGDQLRLAVSHANGRAVEPAEWPLARAARHGETVAGDELLLRRPDGTPVSIRVSAAPVRDVDGNVVGGLATVVDVDRYQRLVAELQRAHGDADEARRTAETANRAKSEFLAVMSHELRQPLNAIQGYVDLLELGLRGPLTDEQRSDLARIRKNQRRLLALINDVLAFARIEAGQLEYAVTDVPLRSVMDDVMPAITPQLMRKQIAFAWDPVDPALTVHADVERVEQILINLLSNAIKFTDGGGTISVTCDHTDDRIAIHVSDTGRGIAAQRLPMIFDPFVQVDRALNSPLEGIGLGLSISRTLARAMHGDVTAESVFGKGSTFTLTLPRT